MARFDMKRMKLQEARDVRYCHRYLSSAPGIRPCPLVAPCCVAKVVYCVIDHSSSVPAAATRSTAVAALCRMPTTVPDFAGGCVAVAKGRQKKRREEGRRCTSWELFGGGCKTSVRESVRARLTHAWSSSSPYNPCFQRRRMRKTRSATAAGMYDNILKPWRHVGYSVARRLGLASAAFHGSNIVFAQCSDSVCALTAVFQARKSSSSACWCPRIGGIGHRLPGARV